MTLRHTATMSGLLLVLAGPLPVLSATPEQGDPAEADAAQSSPAPVYLIKESDAKRAVVAQTQASENERQAVQLRVNAAVDTLRHMGIVTASAVLMLLGSAVIGIGSALLFNVYRNARARRARL